VVIGGIYEHEEASSRTKVPFLGDVPVLGSLLRSSGRQARRTELLVFLTPRVITELASAPQGVAVGSLN
jgi:type IV pilus assembly protein PilQ